MSVCGENMDDLIEGYEKEKEDFWRWFNAVGKDALIAGYSSIQLMLIAWLASAKWREHEKAKEEKETQIRVGTG